MTGKPPRFPDPPPPPEDDDAAPPDERGYFADQPTRRATPASLRPPTEDQHYHGHRERLRSRFRDNGDTALADYELLELLLFVSFPAATPSRSPRRCSIDSGRWRRARRAAGPAAGGEGDGDSVALDLKLIATIGHRTLKSELRNRTMLSSWAQVIDYCHAAMAHETREQFRILFLDKRNQLIADEVQQTGTIDHTPVYPREVARRALELSATALILVHNHPSGDPTPSRADIDMTRTIAETILPLGVVLHDHIIVGKDGHASLKGMKLI